MHRDLFMHNWSIFQLWRRRRRHWPIEFRKSREPERCSCPVGLFQLLAELLDEWRDFIDRWEDFLTAARASIAGRGGRGREICRPLVEAFPVEEMQAIQPNCVAFGQCCLAERAIRVVILIGEPCEITLHDAIWMIIDEAKLADIDAMLVAK